MHRYALLCLLPVVALCLPSPAAAQPQPSRGDNNDPVQDTSEEYTVVAGDSCRSIAIQQITSVRASEALQELHRLNPQLGPTPHTLKIGQKLRVPRRAPVTPDATLTAARGEVAVRKPADNSWDVARRGMDLFRAWRVGSRSDSSAEVTFRDTSQLRMRENTVVVIYGPAAPRQPVLAVRAELESGSLEARLAAATGLAPGPRPSILTSSAFATLGQSDVLFSVDAAGTSLVANHSGEPIEVRAATQKVPRGAAVRVASGMGSRVARGKLPEPPRPLPTPPRMSQPTLIVATFAPAASVKVQWQPTTTAIRYRAVVLDEQGAEQNALLIPPGETSFELRSVAPGRLRVMISAIDSDGFEGAPAVLAVRVATLAVAPPGATSAAPTPLSSKIALGSRLIAPAEMTCTLQLLTGGSNRSDAMDTARQLGAHRATCSDASGTSTGVDLEVVAVTAAVSGAAAEVPRDRAITLAIAIASEAALGDAISAHAGPGLLLQSQHWDGKTLRVELRGTPESAATEAISIVSGVDAAGTQSVELASLSVAVAVAATAPRIASLPRWRFDIGGFAGLILPPDGSQLGRPRVQREQLASGPMLGAQLTAQRHTLPWLAGQLEFGVAGLSQVGTSTSVALLVPSARVAVRPMALRSFEFWTFAGAGAARLASAPGSTRTQTELSLQGGAGIVVRNAGLAFHLDALWSVLTPGDDRELWPSIRLGIGSTIDR
jgi:LysM domain